MPKLLLYIYLVCTSWILIIKTNVASLLEEVTPLHPPFVYGLTMDLDYLDIFTGKICRQYRLYTLFIDLFVQPVGGEGMG